MLTVNSMAAVSKGQNAIDYQAVYSSTRIKGTDPVVTFAGPPPNQYQQQADGFAGQFGGVNQMICKYPGSFAILLWGLI